MSLFEVRRRIRWSGFAAVATFLVLAVRLVWLQATPSDALAATALSNALREHRVVSPRGRILDRHGVVLAEARPTVDLVVRPAAVQDPDTLLDHLDDVLDDSGRERLAEALATTGLERHRGWVLTRDMDSIALARVAARRHLLPAIELRAGQIRTYPHGTEVAHLVGYISEVSRDDLLRLERERYRSGDQVGRRGLERELETHLRGEPGRTATIVDSLGRPVQASGRWGVSLEQERRAREVPSGQGADVYTTVDYEVQRATVEALDGRPGAAVMLDVWTGEVLAYASSPTYDPGGLVRGLSRQQWRAMEHDPTRPLLDRNVRGLYPPASTFKMVTAAAAVEAGISPEFTVDCKGSTMVGRRRFRCWKHGGHGLVNLRGALMGSCDVWFYTVGLELGPERLADAALHLGLGPPTGWRLNNERGGLLPSRDYMVRRFGQEWTIGDTASASIGQGITLATPLQLAVMTATVASGGRRPTPWVVDRIVHPDGSTAKVGGPLPPADAGLSPASLAVVRDGMEAV
ncbi:MAG: penicillin-binding protein 2, partial [Deltaproteobacteria bacterium]|nr:penicillin-binding protein 2 [Deltaproteobacteria bacterium]